MLSSSSFPRRFKYGSKASTTPMPEIMTILRKKSITLSMIENETVSFSTEVSWQYRRNTGATRGVLRRSLPDSHERLSGLDAFVLLHRDVGDLAGEFRQ